MKKTWLTVLVLLIFLGFLALAFGLAVWSQRPTGIERQTILEIDLTRAYPEHLAYQPITASFLEAVPTVRTLVDALDRAAADDRVVGVVARVGAAPMGLAKAQEIRDAVARFRESGKPAVAYSDTFGEFQPANVAYYLATAFESVALQPSGDVNLTGFLYETAFFRGTFEKLGVEPQMGQRYEYKNAVNSYTEREMTEPHREALQALADAQFGQVVDGIAAARGLSPEAVRDLSDRGPLLGAEALEAGLVDEIGYRDDVYDRLEEELEDAEFVPLARYTRKRPRVPWRIDILDEPKVALIYGVGAVVRGEGGYDPLMGSQSMGSELVARAFRQAIDDDNVEAILFRISSPGGSYVASDTIWHETRRAQAAGKPVIVSMGNVAASGGYFVSMAADSIVAQPGTVTGSIGVYAGKLLSRGLWEKAGITFDEVATSERARLWSGNHAYSEEDWSRIDAALDRIYEDFTGKVAEGRSMTREQVHEIARGRVWSGEDALELGLVDALGGFEVAMERVREEIGLGEGEEIAIEEFPRPRSPFEMLAEGRLLGTDQRLDRVVEAARPVARLAREIGLLETPPGPLTMELVLPENR